MKKSRPEAIVYDHWWEPLNLIPPNRSDLSYRRLRRLWNDQTRVRNEGGEKIHEFYHQRRETHLTAVLWENFAALDPTLWLPHLLNEAGLRGQITGVTACKWSYGWVRVKPQRKILDVVLNYRDQRGEEGVVVIEAKNLGKSLDSAKDRDPAYYLDVPELQGYARRAQIYLVDAAVADGVKTQVLPSPHDVGFLTWQQLAGIQISAALKTTVPEELRRFIAGSIQRQFMGLGIRPTTLAAAYLEEEPSRSEVAAQPSEKGQTSAEREALLWKLDRRR